MITDSEAVRQFLENPSGPFAPEVQAVIERLCQVPVMSEHPIDRLLREAQEEVEEVGKGIVPLPR